VSAAASAKKDSPGEAKPVGQSSSLGYVDAAREPAYVVCASNELPVTFDTPFPQGIFPTKVTVGDVPVKNTFVNFDLPTEGFDTDPGAPPTVSAPGALLSRLFRTRPTVDASTPSIDSGGSVGASAATPPSFPPLPAFTSPPPFTPAGPPSRPPGTLHSDHGIRPPGVFEPQAPPVLPSETETAQDGEPGGLPDGYDGSEPSYQAHLRKECIPCNYFYYKTDGCRQGTDCPFCHLCIKGEIKRRKKERVKLLKAQNLLNVAEETQDPTGDNDSRLQ